MHYGFFQKKRASIISYRYGEPLAVGVCVHATETIEGILFITLFFLGHNVLEIIWHQHM